MRVAATNQLAALLDAHWPGAKAIFADIESPIALAFLTRYPTAAAARHLGEKRLAAFLVKHGYSGRRPAAELLTRLRAAPAGTTDDRPDRSRSPTPCWPWSPSSSALGARHQETSTARWSPTSGSTRTARSSRRCQGRVRSTPPRCSPSGATAAKPTTAPTPSPPSPACTPVTKESGKHRAVHFRWACNKRFRKAMTTFADNTCPVHGVVVVVGGQFVVGVVVADGRLARVERRPIRRSGDRLHGRQAGDHSGVGGLDLVAQRLVLARHPQRHPPFGGADPHVQVPAGQQLVERQPVINKPVLPQNDTAGVVQRFLAERRIHVRGVLPLQGMPLSANRGAG